jgi:hypothetical protein
MSAPFPILRALTEDASLRLDIIVIEQAADLVNAVAIAGPNVPVDAAISMDGYIQVRAENMPHAPGSTPAQGASDFGIDIIPGPATTLSEVAL